MKTLENIEVPTGNILIVQGDKGKLEMLSLGDYGKDVNVKCDALGLSREPSPVKHTDIMPLTEKWVITISTQYGCSSKCNFCDVPKVGLGKNATFNDLIKQVLTGIKLHPEIENTKRLNISNTVIVFSLKKRWPPPAGFEPAISHFRVRHLSPHPLAGALATELRRRPPQKLPFKHLLFLRFSYTKIRIQIICLCSPSQSFLLCVFILPHTDFVNLLFFSDLFAYELRYSLFASPFLKT